MIGLSLHSSECQSSIVYIIVILYYYFLVHLGSPASVTHGLPTPQLYTLCDSDDNDNLRSR